MPAWLIPALMAGGSLLGKAGGGAAKERTNRNAFAADTNQQAQRGHQFDIQALLQALQQNERGQMDRAQLGITAPQARARQSVIGSMMANGRTAKVQAPPGINVGKVSGGLDIDALLSGARGAGRELNTQANQALQSRSDIPAFTDARAGLTKSPMPQGYKGAGMGESLMSGGGLLASLLGGIMAAKKGGG